MRLKASALLFTLVISLVICLLLSFFILVGYLNKTFLITCENHEKVRGNVMEGLNLLMADESVLKDGEVKELDLFGKGNDSVKLSRQAWGVFEVLTSESHQASYKACKSAIVGYDAGKEKIALYLADRERPLSVCGNNIIHGNSYLPRAGVKTAFIEGTGFTGTKTVDGTVNASKPELPQPDADMLKSLDEQQKQDWKEMQGSVPESFSNSFREPAVVYYSREVLSISAALKGNIKIVSERGVIVEARAELGDVLIIAPFVKIGKDFKGTLQAFATDSLTVEEGVQLKYPSALVLQASGGKPGFIKIAEGTRVSGLVCSLARENVSSGLSRILLEKDTEVNGMVYSSGTLQVKGKVYGSVYTGSFILRTPSSIYENHLLNAEVNSEKLPPYFVISSIFTPEGKKKLLKWVD